MIDNLKSMKERPSLGSSIVKFALEMSREMPRGRKELLLRTAQRVSIGQADIMQQYKRGWSLVMIELDNYARSLAGLPTYSREESPVSVYLDLVNGNDARFKELMARISAQFGESSAQVFSDATLLGYRGANLDDSFRYVPPEQFTYAALRLDDVATHSEPLFV